jgi:hypothetical protein
MDLSSIRLNFESEGEEGTSDIIDFTVQINSFFQKQSGAQ